MLCGNTSRLQECFDSACSKAADAPLCMTAFGKKIVNVPYIIITVTGKWLCDP
jgi:hypothetical protein